MKAKIDILRLLSYSLAFFMLHSPCAGSTPTGCKSLVVSFHGLKPMVSNTAHLRRAAPRQSKICKLVLLFTRLALSLDKIGCASEMKIGTSSFSFHSACTIFALKIKVMERKFKTSAKCAGCVKAIGEKLSAVLSDGDWSIDLNSADRVLSVSADEPTDAVIEQLVREAGFKIEKI